MTSTADSGRRTPEAAHLLILVIVLALLWGSVAPAILAGWAAVIVTITETRGVVRRRLLRSEAVVHASLRRLRPMLAATGLAWGIGAEVFMQDIPAQTTGLLLVVLSGLAAGAIGAKGLAALLLQLEEAGKAGEVALARGLEGRFRTETVAVLVYLREALAVAPPKS